MTFTLPRLPYTREALEPHMSAETLSFHHGKHHRAYVDKLNELVPDSPYAGLSLEALVKATEGKSAPLFNNAAQAWNHQFFWESMTPGGSKPTAALAEKLKATIGDWAAFRAAFIDAGKAHFGSGWLWLVLTPEGRVVLKDSHDAATPITGADVPLIVCDVWEHAYYIDVRNDRAAFLGSFFDHLADWAGAGARLSAAMA